MAKYYQRSDGLYETTRTIKGKRVRFYGKTCREVDKKILEYNVDAQRGRKFPVVADEWYASIEPSVAHSTYRTYSFALGRLKEYFTGHVGDIRPLDIKRYVASFEGKGYSKQTVQIELGVLKQIMAHAVLAGDIDTNPAAEVRHSRNLPVTKRSALTEEQELAVETYRGEWYLLGLMLLYTGCRRGELLALNWQDVDRDAGVIRVTKKLNYSFGNTPHLEHDLKSENGRREIPIFEPLAAGLPREPRIGLIFPSEDGNYLTASQVNNRWINYCKAVGLTEWTYTDHGKPVEVPAVTPHCFRHSFATILYEAGVDPKASAAIIGDTEEVVRKNYEELRERHSMTSAEKVNAYIEARRSAAGGNM